MANTNAPTLLTVGPLDARIADAIATRFPTAVIQSVGPDSLRALPVSAGLFVTDGAHARTARATGYTAPIVIVAAASSDEERASFLEQGTCFLEVSTDGTSLRDGIAVALRIGSDGHPERTSPQVARTRQLIAAGEIALSLQHALNNPLTALMAEIQMLQIDAPDDEVKATAARMLDLVRRLAELTRSLDGVRDRSRRL